MFPETLVNWALGDVLEARLDTPEGFSWLLKLIHEEVKAEGCLWIREANLSPAIWEREAILEALEGFLKSNGTLHLGFHKVSDKSNALGALKDGNPKLSKLLGNYLSKNNGIIKIYWWKKGYDTKPHLFISQNSVGIEQPHIESCCSIANFFFDDINAATYWQAVYKDAADNKSSHDVLEEFSKAELKVFVKNLGKSKVK